ncbi:MAG: baseplate J/gp47 family protein [Isosphaeraceae bacterium]
MESVRAESGLTVVRWSTAVQKDWDSDPRASRFRRKFRLFGFDIPARFTALRRSTVSIDGTDVPTLLPESATRDASNYAVLLSSLGIAGVVDGLQPGTRLLVIDGTNHHVITVAGTAQVAAVLGPAPTGTELFWEPPTAAATRVTPVETFTTESVDARTAVVYELAGPEIRAWPFVVAPSLDGQTVAARPENLTPAELAPGRTVFVVDAAGKAARARVTDVAADAASGQTFVTISATLAGFDSATALLLGNVARASHGEPVAGEVIGSGDAAASFQTFTLKKAQVSHVPAVDDPGRIRSALRLRVDGVRWRPVESLYDRGANEQVYEERLDEAGRTVVRFGDSTHGPRAPTGRNNLVADYRVGIGRDGNVGPGTLTTPLDRPTGLKAVTNPEKAIGGSDPETIEQARQAAPRTVRTFGRIVSLQDFEDAALDHPVVAKARASVVWDGEEQAVSLTVAGEDGEVIEDTARDDLLAYLDARRDPYRKLDLVAHTPVPLAVALTVQVDPNRDESAVVAAVRQALLEAFAFESQSFGRSVFLSGVYQVVQQVAGVEAALATQLQYREPAARVAHGAAADPVLVRLRILPHELAALEPEDLTVATGRIDPQAAAN